MRAAPDQPHGLIVERIGPVAGAECRYHPTLLGNRIFYFEQVHF
jgi:hypothetical protein